MKRRPYIPLYLTLSSLLAAFLFLPGAALGQDVGNLYHWAYSPAFGTGVYNVDGDNTFVITYTPKINLRKQVDDRIGIKLTLPVSLGLQTLDLDKIISEDLPDYISTISFVPGIEFLIPVGQSWMVKPFGNFGWGTSFSGDESAWIYFGGAKSRYIFSWGKSDLGFLNELLWSGYKPTPGQQDDFARFMLGLEADYPLGNLKFRKQQLLIRPHILYYRYFNDLDFLTPTEELISLDEEIELAVAVGTKAFQNFWLFNADRFGVGLRYSKNLVGIRIFFGSVFE